jgi:oxygen-dependent protoporphyrinogen oxidase
VPRVAIIGGGVTGLAAAYYLERLTDFEVDLYEKTDRLGGKISSTREAGFLVEGSADSIFLKTDFPDWEGLWNDLELAPETISPNPDGFSMLIGGRLWPVPRGLTNFGNVTLQSLGEAGFLSEEGRQRAALESKIPAGPSGNAESIASFFRRRFGVEFSQLVVEPLLAGTHSGRPEDLSMRALYPRYLQMELEHGSLAAAPKSAAGAKFVSFNGGIQTLTERLASRLKRTRVNLNASRSLSRDLAEAGQAVVLAVPAKVAAAILETVEPEASHQLASMETASGTVVTLGFDSPEVAAQLYGTGFLTPFTENRAMRGATFSSSKWCDRAPEGKALVRVFLTYQPKDATEIALEELSSLFQLTPPTYAAIEQWVQAMPLYKVGHLEKLDKIDSALADLGLVYLAGQSYRGVGIADCLRQGRDVAVKIAKAL